LQGVHILPLMSRTQFHGHKLRKVQQKIVTVTHYYSKKHSCYWDSSSYWERCIN